MNRLKLFLLFFISLIILVSCDIGGTTYKVKECNWNDNYSEATLIITDGINDIELESTVTITEKDSTCTTNGYIKYVASGTYKGKTYSDELFIEKDLISHTFKNVDVEWEDQDTAYLVQTCSLCGEVIKTRMDVSVESFVDETCETIGTVTKIATVIIDGKEYSDTKSFSILSYGHNYVFDHWRWDDDYNAYGVFVCQNDSSHIVEIKATVTSQEKKATCTQNGYISYTASLEYGENKYHSSKLVTLEALGHDYQFSSSIWSEDYSECSIELVCSHDSSHVIVLPMIVTTEEIDDGYQFTSTINYNGVEYSDVRIKKIQKLRVNAFNTQGETIGFSAYHGIELFDNSTSIGSSLYWIKIALVKTNDNYEVVEIALSGDAISSTYDYLMLAWENDSDAYNLLNDTFSVGDFIEFSQNLTTLEKGSVDVAFQKVEINGSFKIDYDLSFDYFETKDDLYKAFFTDYYYFLISYTTCDMDSYGIENVDDFLSYCKNWNANGGNEMAGLGNAFGRFYLTPTTNGTIETQPTTTFLGYIYNQGKYLDLIEHLEVFFGYWRTDEGYSLYDEHGNDFYYGAWAAFVDTCKFFYFTSETLPNTYKWFTIEKSPRVHYMLDNIPGVGKIDLVKESSDEVILPIIERMHYRFLGWFDESNNKVNSLYSTYSKTFKVHAKFDRIVHEINFYSNGSVETVFVNDGLRLKSTTLTNSGYKFYKYVTDTKVEIDPLNGVTEDLDLYVLWYKEGIELGPYNIYSYNTESATSVVTQYNGTRLYKAGVSIDASLYWYKLTINELNGKYYVSNITSSGTSTPSGYDYIILVYSADNTGCYNTLTSAGFMVGDEIVFSKDLSSLNNGETSLTFSVSRGETNYNNLVLVSNGAENFKYSQNVDGNVTLPTPRRSGYDFAGWFDNLDFVGNRIEEITVDGIIYLYAKWEEKVYNGALDYISDRVSSYTYDLLPLSYNDQDVTYRSSNPNLYTIEDGIGHTNRMYQTHNNQYVTVYANIGGVEYSKEILIEPVIFDDMDHPLSVYFAVSSMNSYKKYSERYQSSNELFSDGFKNTFNMLYYAFGSPNSDGTIDINDTYMSEVLKLKNYGVRILFVIDGANSGSLKNLVQVCNDATLRKTFVNNIYNLIVKYNLDGVDIDWEFPGLSGVNGYTTEIDIANMNALVKELREKFSVEQDEPGTEYLITAATPPTYWGVDRYDYATLNKYLDYVNMMSYDLNKSSTTSHLSHVYTPSNSYSYKFCCEYGISYYTSLGLDSSKIILGCAAYGKTYNITGTVDSNATYPALGVSATLGQAQGFGLAGQSITWNSGTIFYTGIEELRLNPNFKQYDEYNSSGKFVGSYLYSATDKIFITYDSILGITEKCKLAQQYAGMGLMIWSYGEDATDTVTNTIIEYFNK